MLRIVEVPHGSADYERTVVLRHAVLRAPLGLTFTAEELAAERDSLHLAAFDGDELVACLVLHPLGNREVQMRQVAVAEGRQRRGVGTELAGFAERYAAELGYALMVVHARETVAGFYTRMGYERTGEPFVEVTLPHTRMHKPLSAPPSPPRTG